MTVRHLHVFVDLPSVTLLQPCLWERDFTGVTDWNVDLDPADMPVLNFTYVT